LCFTVQAGYMRRFDIHAAEGELRGARLPQVLHTHTRHALQLHDGCVGGRVCSADLRRRPPAPPRRRAAGRRWPAGRAAQPAPLAPPPCSAGIHQAGCQRAPPPCSTWSGSCWPSAPRPAAACRCRPRRCASSRRRRAPPPTTARRRAACSTSTTRCPPASPSPPAATACATRSRGSRRTRSAAPTTATAGTARATPRSAPARWAAWQWPQGSGDGSVLSALLAVGR
jgi:hypothetical protein